MLKKILLPAIFVILAWGFWVSPQFKEISAGVAIFLFGMMALEHGFKALTGGVLEKLLHATTNRLWKSLGFGIVTTTLMQSSSLVSVLTISFLSAGLIDLAAGLGIIFGSNIGTTTGAWLVAGVGLKINIAAYAMPLIVFGVILVFQSSKSFQGLGYVLAGIGFLFLGIHYMKTGFETFQESIDLAQFSMTGLAGLLVYTAIGILATVVMQSSHATLILGITALAAGQITYENSLAIAIGSNVGTTITAMLGAMSANVAGKRLALGHLIFNLTTGVIAIVFISVLAQVVDAISGAVGIAPDNFTLKFAVFHTLFNLIGVMIMAPLITFLVGLLGRLVPEKALDVSMPRYLNEAALELPDTALKAIVMEASHLYNNAFDLMATGLGLDEGDLRSNKTLKEVVNEAEPRADVDFDDLYRRRIKELYSALVEFMTKAQPNKVPEQLELLEDVRSVVRGLVHAVKDVKHLNKNLRRYVGSENTDIFEQYNAARILVATVLRATQQIKNDKDASLQVLGQLEADIDKYDIVDNGTVDRLIREDRITPEMASSLINDSGYTQNICRNLINAGLVVLRDRTYDLLLAAREDLASAETGSKEDAEDISGAEARASSA